MVMTGSVPLMREPFPLQNIFTETAPTKCSDSDTASAMRSAPLGREKWNSCGWMEGAGIVRGMFTSEPRRQCHAKRDRIDRMEMPRLR